MSTDPDRPAQCGRTIIHLPHTTTRGRCAGLDGTEVIDVPAPDHTAGAAKARKALQEARRG